MLSHDQNFKNLIIDYPLQAVRAFAPEEAAKLPPGVVFTPIRQEQLKERLDDSFRELDVPLKVEFPDGTTEALLFVFENESGDRAEFLHYLAGVCLDISRSMKTRRVVPVAVHLFRRKPLDNRLTLGSSSRTYLDFSCLSCSLGTISARERLESDNLVERLCLPLMAYDPADRFLVVTRAFEGLVAQEADAVRRVKYAGFISQYAAIEAREQAEIYEQHIKRSPYREDIMTLADVWEENGIAKGEARGEANGQIRMLLELFREHTLSAGDARAKLMSLSQRGIASPEAVAEALEQIKPE